MADWSALTQELLYMISLLLTSSIDIIRFRSVCTTWRAAAVQPRPDPTSSNPIIADLLGSPMNHTFYLAKRTFYAVQSRNNNPLWIICLGQDFNSNHMNNLYNPFTFGLIKTIPLTFPKSFSFLNLSVLELGENYNVCALRMYTTLPRNDKAAVLKGLDDTFVILSFRYLSPGHEMNVYESGVKEWREIKVPVKFGPLVDVLLAGGKFYAIDHEGRLLNVNHIDLSVRIIVGNPAVGSIPKVGCSYRKKFLVECEGNLVLVNMHYVVFDDYQYLYNTVEYFELFRLDANAGKWVEVHDLGGMILFVGETYTLSASAKDIFAEIGTPTYGKGNCIFFYDHDKEKLGVRVFNMETGTINKVDIRTDDSLIFWPPPVWASIN